MRWSMIVAGAMALLAGVPAAAGQAGPAPAITLSGVEQGIDQGSEADRAAETQRLRLSELTVTATLAGPLADIEIELLIASNAQQGDAESEARLGIDLPADAVVTGYALDIDGQLIPGQLLEAAKARNVYEDEVRKGIDPGLAEVSARNRFTTQVYPVTPDHPRRVRLRFSVAFDPAKGLELPLDTALPVGTARLVVRAEGYGTAPQIGFAGQALTLQRSGGSWQGSTRLDGSRLAGGLSLQGSRVPGQMLITRHANGRRFFTIAGSAEPGTPAKTGGRLRVYWDRSLSHGGKGLADEIAALAALVESARPDGIDLVTFASNGPQVSTLADAAALRSALAGVTYRGATSLAGLDALNLPQARQCLLVSDGHLTIGRSAAFQPDCRLSALSADPGADGTRLARLTGRQGGRFIRIAPGQGPAAAAALRENGASVVAVTSDTAGRIQWRSLSWEDGSWLVIGELPFDTRMPSPGDIRVRLALPGGASREQAYAPDGAPIAIDAAGALWAGDRVAELADRPEQHDRMLALARTFSVAGNGLSFLVLDQPEQYLKAEIAPPPGFPQDWTERYAEAKAEQDQSAKDARAERLADVIAAWRDRQDWWNTRFAARPSRKRNQQQDRDARFAPPPPPPPPPPPAPVMAPAPLANVRQSDAAAAAEESGSDLGEVIVTASRRTTSSQDAPGAVTVVTGQNLAAKSELKLENLLADRPYLKALDAAPASERLAVLERQQAEFGSVPAFYFDVAEWFRLSGDRATARELLLSALELDSANDETLQIIAFRLERDGDSDLAVELAERFASGARFLPQPQRVLALALAARARAGGKTARADLERAFTLLTEVALAPNKFGNDYDGLEVIALVEANSLIPAIEAAGGTWKLDPRLVGLMDTDARIVIEWTADDADIDLWVDEPGGERVMYSHNRSQVGGMISNDMTDGYGPEEYAIRRAPKGTYVVRVNGYDADRINPNGPGHVLVRLTRDFARPGQRNDLVDVDLSFQKGRDRNEADKAIKVAELKVN